MIKDHIKNFAIWRDQDFWLEFFNGMKIRRNFLTNNHFSDELMSKYRQHNPNAATVDPDFAATLVCSFGK